MKGVGASARLAKLWGRIARPLLVTTELRKLTSGVSVRASPRFLERELREKHSYSGDGWRIIGRDNAADSNLPQPVHIRSVLLCDHDISRQVGLFQQRRTLGDGLIHHHHAIDLRNWLIHQMDPVIPVSRQ